jgi:hypothetical protein
VSPAQNTASSNHNFRDLPSAGTCLRPAIRKGIPAIARFWHPCDASRITSARWLMHISVVVALVNLVTMLYIISVKNKKDKGAESQQPQGYFSGKLPKV